MECEKTLGLMTTLESPHLAFSRKHGDEEQL